MRALIVTGGEHPPLAFVRQLSKNADLVIAADSGLEVCLEARIDPDLVVGDFDSVRRELLSGLHRKKIIEFPEDKDYTDTELAIEAARARGADRIALAGGGAGRLDHLLAVRALFERQGPIREWHTANESVFLLPARTTLDFEAPENSLVSVFPLAGGASGMRSSGLKWPLEGLVWDCGHFGVSNRSVSGAASVGSGAEPLLVVLPLGAKISFVSGG